MNNKINKRSTSVQLKRINFNNSKNNKKELFFPYKNQTVIKNLHNTTNKYFNNISIDWEERNKKLEKKFEKICQERYDKEFGGMRNTPKIDKKSKKIINSLLSKSEKNIQQKNNNFNISQLNNIDNNSLIEYYKIFNNRKKKNNNLNSDYIKQPVKKISNTIKNRKRNKEEYKNNNNKYFNSINIEDTKLNNVYNKFHLNINYKDNNSKNETIFDKYFYSRNNEYFNKSNSLLNNSLPNKIITIFEKNNNSSNENQENYINKKIISSCEHLNLNKYYEDKKIKKYINQKDNIKNLKKNNFIINRRTNDLKKFMLFTNNIQTKNENDKKDNIKTTFEKQNKLQKSSILKKTKKLPIGSPII